jgi:hypothetical protein
VLFLAESRRKIWRLDCSVPPTDRRKLITTATTSPSHAKYEENGYKPDFDKLPLEADYWAAQEEARKREAQRS